MPSKSNPPRKKPPGILEIVCLALAVLFVASLYAIGFVREIIGKDRDTGRGKTAVEIIKGQVQPPLPGAARKDAGEQPAGDAEKK